ncbi:MAG: hypothetical protein MI861_10245, partial [Pirellulales bacterium]|nr:hypothetical protein [Pirellulales bacterium]
MKTSLGNVTKIKAFSALLQHFSRAMPLPGDAAGLKTNAPGAKDSPPERPLTILPGSSNLPLASFLVKLEAPAWRP